MGVALHLSWTCDGLFLLAFSSSMPAPSFPESTLQMPIHRPNCKQKVPDILTDLHDVCKVMHISCTHPFRQVDDPDLDSPIFSCI